MSESDEFVVDAVYQEEDLGEWQYTEEDKKHTKTRQAVLCMDV